LRCDAGPDHLNSGLGLGLGLGLGHEFRGGLVRNALVYAATEAGVRTRMFMLALVLGSSSRGVQAQVPEPGLPRLRYEAPDACPDQSFFTERMRARLRANDRRALSSLSLRVKLERNAASVRGSVEIERGSTTAQRSLEGASCKEVVEGLALIAALAVAAPANRPARAKSRLARSGPRTPSPFGSTVRSEVATPVDAPAPPPTAATGAQASPRQPAPDVQNPAAQYSELPANESPPAPTPGRAPQTTDVLRDSESSTSAAPPRADVEGDVPVRWSVAGALLALHGLAPAIQPGLQLEAAMTFDTSALDWSVRLGGRGALDHTLRSTQGIARFGFIAAVVQLCATGELGQTGFTLGGCAAAEPGIFSTGADDTQHPRTYTRAWFAAGGGAELGWRVADWLIFRAGAEALVPVRRDRMILAGELLHRVSPACLRLELGVEVPLG
jgi:hypothetical protein